MLYPWHRWFGQVIYIHEAAEERGGRVLHCDLENKPNARCLTVPAWMFDLSARTLTWRHKKSPEGGLLVSLLCTFTPAN